MELKILESDKNRLVFEISGADHTLCNALKKELVHTAGVEIATYAIEHPQIGIPKMIVETKGAVTPKKALESAIETLKEKNKEFTKLFVKSAK